MITILMVFISLIKSKFNKVKRFSISLLFLLLLISCNITGEEVGRLLINKVSSDENNFYPKQTSISLNKGDKISFWSEMDMSYEGDVALRFRLDILKDSLPYAALDIDPMEKNVTLGEVKTDINGKVEWRFTGKNSSLTVDEKGKYTFRGILIASDNPTLQIDKAEIVLKK